MLVGNTLRPFVVAEAQEAQPFNMLFCGAGDLRSVLHSVMDLDLQMHETAFNIADTWRQQGKKGGQPLENIRPLKLNVHVNDLLAGTVARSCVLLGIASRWSGAAELCAGKATTVQQHCGKWLANLYTSAWANLVLTAPQRAAIDQILDELISAAESTERFERLFWKIGAAGSNSPACHEAALEQLRQIWLRWRGVELHHPHLKQVRTALNAPV